MNQNDEDLVRDIYAAVRELNRLINEANKFNCKVELEVTRISQIRIPYEWSRLSVSVFKLIEPSQVTEKQ